MRRPDADHDPPDGPAAAAARLAGPLVHVEPLLHLAVAVGRRVVVDRGAAAFDGLGEDRERSRYSAPLVGRSKGPGRAERVEPGPPQRLVRVDVADARDERLVDEQRLQPRPPPADPMAELPQREPRIERLRADVVERVVVGAVQADPAELADVAEPELAAVVEPEREPLVRVARQRGGHDEQLARHLEVDREEGATREVEDELLAPAPDPPRSAGP